ncbi:MAG: acyl-CoA dehydrogenase [Anaerolineae bacterium]|jgi:butyryl-CoA dehydrogenase|nr:acyl-CoA dehydrogenase [Anaerolineae bacterium]MBT7072148.1 acyl-CoA dehydrogenase [Anaerolineae bacterium]MBT7988336.1 acyl-CoA dehydrogenase [Anaerolineae bacterium]
MNFDLTDEQKMWQKIVHDFVAAEVQPKAHEISESGEFNWDAVHKMAELGMLGMMVSEKYGGSEVGTVNMSIAIEELGWACGSTALAIAAHTELGCAPLAKYGTHEQKKKFLKPVATGEGKLAALALTEPGAGSDLKGGVTTKAEKDGGEWIINGAKMWITNPSVADYIITLARTAPGTGSDSMSMFIVPADAPGLIIHPAEKKMGLHASQTHALTYENVRIPADYLLGEEGRGLHQTLDTLDAGRISIGSLSVGLAQAALEAAIKYAKEREAFGKPIADKQAIQWMLADAATEIAAARLMMRQAAWLHENGRPFSHQAAMGKLFATEMAERVAYKAIQIHGGYGYSREYPVERIYCDARLMTIGEGTSEIQRLVIARNILKG